MPAILPPKPIGGILANPSFAMTSPASTAALAQPSAAATRPPITNPGAAFTAPPGGSPMPPIGYSNAPAPTVTSPIPPVSQQPSGIDMMNPGLSEQTFNATQNRMSEDPYAAQTQAQYQQTQQPSAGEAYLNQNLGSLNGPGQGEQYWNQVQGQFQNPFAGEQFTRQATQNMSPTGPAGAFFDNAMGQYGDFTGYQGPQAAAGQYGANASGGPLAGQQFYNQVAGQAGTTGKYTDPNLAAGQYQQTQQAFGDLPVANFDPFYDRARQLGVQSYNQNAAGRGVYGSSEALNGVGNVITDIEAQRANRSFDAEMQRAQEQRMRQGLLGEQARMGDLSSLAGFGANLSGLETFGNLANAAGNQTLGQQTMLGNQARDVDIGAQNAQNSNLAGVNAFGNLAGQADTAETNRYTSTTNAMNNADRTTLERNRTGADIANQVDTTNRANYDSQNNAAQGAGQLQNQRISTGINAANVGSGNDLARLQATNSAAQGAEGQRQNRITTQLDQVFRRDSAVSKAVGSAMDNLSEQGQKDFENAFMAEMAPVMNDSNLSESEKQLKLQAWLKTAENLYH